MKPDHLKQRIKESGNVLFLILIAVALFAALSYAVTQSSRSGSNDSSREKSLISSAQITQYPAGVRTAVVRMVINGVATDELYFNPPSDFGAGLPIDDSPTDTDATDQQRAVFHPDGGGAPYQLAPPELMATGVQQEWVFSPRWQVDRIGRTNAASAAGNDIIAFLPNVSRAVCMRINEELGIVTTVDGDGDGVPPGGTTTEPTIADHSMLETPAYAAPWGGAPIAVIGTNDDNNGVDFSAQPFGCFDLDDGDGTSASVFVYYHVMIER